MKVDPLQLEVSVGDTGQVHVVLLNGSGDTIPTNARLNGGLAARDLSPLVYDSVAEVVGRTQSAMVTTMLIEGVSPGLDTIYISYRVHRPCTDWPECQTARSVDILGQQVTITVR